MKPLLFIIGFLPVFSGNAQTLNDLKQATMELTELKYQESHVRDEAGYEIASLDEKYYHLQLKHSADERKWFHYDVHCVDMRQRLYSYFESATGMQFMQHASDSLKLKDRLDHWDSVYYYIQNPTVFTGLVLLQPFVSTFFPARRRLLQQKICRVPGKPNYRFRNPHTGIVFSVFVNEEQLIDSMHIEGLNNPKARERVYFRYFELKYKSGRVLNLAPLPDVYPMNLSNPNVLKIVSKPYLRKQMSSTDTAVAVASLSSKSRYLLLDFWFIGCRPCHKGFPFMSDLRKSFADSVLEIRALNPIDDAVYIKRFSEHFRWNFNMQKDSSALSGYFNVRMYPTAVLLDRQGRVLLRKDNTDAAFFDKVRAIILEHP